MFSSILAFTSSIFPGISSVSSSVIHERTSSSSSISPLKIKGSLFLKKANVGKVLIPCFFAKPMSSVVTKMMPVSSSSSSIFSSSLRILSHSSPSSQSPPNKSYYKTYQKKKLLRYLSKEILRNTRTNLYKINYYTRYLKKKNIKVYKKVH